MVAMSIAHACVVAACGVTTENLGVSPKPTPPPTCPNCGASDTGETHCTYCRTYRRAYSAAPRRTESLDELRREIARPDAYSPPPSTFRVIPPAHEQRRVDLDPTGLLDPLNITSPLSPLYVGRDTSSYDPPPPAPAPAYDPPAPSPDCGSTFDPGHGSGW